MNNINETKEYHKNPRKISKKQHELLESSLVEFGDLSGIIVNIRTGEIIGGNQRSAIFRKKDAEIEITERYTSPSDTGTMAIGYVISNGEKYAYREVDWDEKTAESANIRANKIGGQFDFDILANQFDIDILTESGFDDSELGFAKFHDLDTARDENDLAGGLETYLSNSIKQIVLYFNAQEYELIVKRLAIVGRDNGLESNTDVIEHILKYYEDNNSQA